MAFTHGKKAALTIEGTDITKYIASVSPAFERTLAEMRHLGAGSVERVAGHKDSRLTLEGDFDPALDAVLWAAYTSDEEVDVVYGPQGSGAGSVKFTIPMLLSRYSPGPAGNDAVKASAELSGSGTDVTKGTF